MKVSGKSQGTTRRKLYVVVAPKYITALAPAEDFGRSHGVAVDSRRMQIVWVVGSATGARRDLNLL